MLIELISPLNLSVLSHLGDIDSNYVLLSCIALLSLRRLKNRLTKPWQN